MIADGWLEWLQRRRPLRSPPGTVGPGAERHAPATVGPRAQRRASESMGPRRLRGAPGSIGLRGLRRPAMPRPSPRLVLVVVALVVLLASAWLWLRDSSLVAVDRVSVSGESGPDARQIRSALVAAARNMTTLDVHTDQLRIAVAPYPVVKDLRVSTQFPHGMRIRVIEQIPVGAVVVAGRTIAVAGDGTLLHDVIPSSALPMIPLRVPPGGSRLSEPDALHAVELLAAAPYQLLSHVSQVTTDSSHGLVAQLRNGPSIYFGDATRLDVKWLAASAVLADAGSRGAVYIDVTDPERPAAGAGSTGGGTGSTGSGAGSGAATSSPSGAATGSPSGAATSNPTGAITGSPYGAATSSPAGAPTSSPVTTSTAAQASTSPSG